MNLSKIAATLLVAAGLCVGQTAPSSGPPVAPDSPPVAQTSAPVPAPAPLPDVTVIGPKATVVEPTEPEVKEPQPIQTAPKAVGPAGAAPSSSSATAPTAADVKDATKPSPPAKKKNSDSASPASGSQAKPAAGDAARYILGPNDIVGVLVWDDKSLSNTYTIGPDGLMSMPLINEFKAVGLTTLQLKDVITEKLKEWINDPEVTVQLLRNNSKKYTLIGGVYRSGPFPLVQETTILDALAGAGGFKDFANPKKIYLLRKGKKYPFNYKEVVAGKRMEQNIPIEDGDIIYVPE